MAVSAFYLQLMQNGVKLGPQNAQRARPQTPSRRPSLILLRKALPSLSSCCQDWPHPCQNTFSTDFIYQNLMVKANVVEETFQNRIKKLLFLILQQGKPEDFLNATNEDNITGERLKRVAEKLLDDIPATHILADLRL
jgi:hypothetical protein